MNHTTSTAHGSPSPRAIFLLCCIFESIAYGIASVVFLVCIREFIARKAPGRLVFAGAASLLFLLTTIHLIGVCIRTYIGFITSLDGPKEYFSSVTTKENTATQAGQVGAILLSDLFAVYRVYQFCLTSSRVTMLIRLSVSSIAYICTFAFAVTFIVIQEHTDQFAGYYTTRVYDWTLVFIASSLVTTALSTGIVSYELWKVDRVSADTPNANNGLARRFIRIFVESAALYSLNNLLYLILFACNNNVQSIFSTLAAPVASITFSDVLLRLQRTKPAGLPHTSSSSKDNEDDNSLGRRPMGEVASRTGRDQPIHVSLIGA